MAFTGERVSSFTHYASRRARLGIKTALRSAFSRAGISATLPKSQGLDETTARRGRRQGTRVYIDAPLTFYDSGNHSAMRLSLLSPAFVREDLESGEAVYRVARRNHLRGAMYIQFWQFQPTETDGQGMAGALEEGSEEEQLGEQGEDSGRRLAFRLRRSEMGKMTRMSDEDFELKTSRKATDQSGPKTLRVASRSDGLEGVEFQALEDSLDSENSPFRVRISDGDAAFLVPILHQSICHIVGLDVATGQTSVRVDAQPFDSDNDDSSSLSLPSSHVE